METDDTKGVDVGSNIHGFGIADDLLGAHIRDCSDDLTGMGLKRHRLQVCVHCPGDAAGDPSLSGALVEALARGIEYDEARWAALAGEMGRRLDAQGD